MYPQQQVLDFRDFVARTRNAVEVEVAAHPHQVAVVGRHIGKGRQRVGRGGVVIAGRLAEYVVEIAHLAQLGQEPLKTLVAPDIVQVGILPGMGIVVVTVPDSLLEGIDSRPLAPLDREAAGQVVIGLGETPRTLVDYRVGQRLATVEKLPVGLLDQIVVLPTFLYHRLHLALVIHLHAIGIPFSLGSPTPETEGQKHQPQKSFHSLVCFVRI